MEKYGNSMVMPQETPSILFNSDGKNRRKGGIERRGDKRSGTGNMKRE